MRELANRYRQDLFDSVLPFWMRHSVDREHGGFFTCLDRDGSIYDPRKYVWLNGRQVWMLSKLYNEAERRDDWIQAAIAGATFLRKHARDPQGRYYFSLTREGQPVFFQRKPYGAVFVMLGLVELARATDDDSARREAVELFHAIRRWIAHPAALDRPVFPGAPRVRQLADTMVVASMALELHGDAPQAGAPSAEYESILRECLDAALAHEDHRRNILLENIPAGSEPDAASGLRQLPDGRLFCPGHSAEVCWFLLHILERFPDSAKQRRVLDILDASLRFGWDEQYGGLYYFMDIQGRPPLQLEAPMKLWWPHTEALYASICAWTMTREQRWLDWTYKIDDYIYRTFPDSAHGEWFGYCDREGRLTHTLKGNNYKGCFHVPRALWLSIQRIERAGVSS